MSFRFNGYIAVGGVMLLLFFFLSIFGTGLSSFRVDEAEKFIYVGDGTGDPELFLAPHPPSRRHIFGTDKWGYDLYTQMLAGAKYTFFGTLAIAALRVVLGSLLGLIAAVTKVQSGAFREKERRASPYGAVPVFIMLYFILNGINFNPPYPPSTMALIQGVLIVLFGVPATFVVTRNHGVLIMARPYITAARSIGAGRLRLAYRHVLPQMGEHLLILFSKETVSVLSLMGALALFNIYFGGTRMTDRPTLYHSITHEWAGLVGQYHASIQGANWLLFFPLLFYFLVLFALYLLSIGLEKAFSGSYRMASS